MLQPAPAFDPRSSLLGFRATNLVHRLVDELVADGKDAVTADGFAAFWRRTAASDRTSPTPQFNIGAAFIAGVKASF